MKTTPKQPTKQEQESAILSSLIAKYDILIDNYRTERVNKKDYMIECLKLLSEVRADYAYMLGTQAENKDN